jgi:hypothetical protein
MWLVFDFSNVAEAENSFSYTILSLAKTLVDGLFHTSVYLPEGYNAYLERMYGHPCGLEAPFVVRSCK